VSGAAFAQSNVEIYGNLDIGYLNSDHNTKDRNVATGAVTKFSQNLSSTGFNDGALSTNHIGFRGTEDLGNGLKAHFQIELGMNEGAYLGADSGGGEQAGTALAAGTQAFSFRKQNIGLSGGFGMVTLGRQATLIDDVWAIGNTGMKNNAVGDMYSSAYTNRNADSRANELMTYMSPNFSGFQVAVQYGKGKNDQTQKLNGILDAAGNSDGEHTNYGMSATYSNGPLNVGFGYNNEKNTNTTNNAADLIGSKFDRDSWLLGANYNFGIVKVFGQYFMGDRGDRTYAAASVNNDKTSSDVDGWEVGVHVPVTAQITLFGSYFDQNQSSKFTDTAVPGVVEKVNGDGGGYQLGALYSLSKRTTAYFAYGNESYDDRTKTNGVTDFKFDAKVRQYAIGLKHAF
jgi:predicted porin